MLTPTLPPRENLVFRKLEPFLTVAKPFHAFGD